MSPKKQMPKFTDEREEGRWLREHQDELEEYFDEPTPEQLARSERMLAKITAERGVRPPTLHVPLRIPVADIERAKAIAARKGLPYQTYLKMLIHQGLEREALS